MARRAIELKGNNELTIKLKKNTDLSDVKRVVKTNTAEMNRIAQRNAPVDTGFLRRMITMSLTNSGFTGKSIAGAEYSPYPEYGTRFMSAQPFMGPAFRMQKAKFKSDLERLMK